MSTYTLISSQVLSGSAASITFSSIPSTYTDLVLKMSVNLVGGSSTLSITFNSDSGTNYSGTMVYGTGSSAFSSVSSNQTYFGNWLNVSNSGIYPSTEIYIPSYTAAQNKPFSIANVNEANTTAVTWTQANAQLWRNTAAINRIDITSGLSLATGSSFYLYGIKNS